MPIGLTNIGWKMYMINGSWDIVVVVLIVSSSYPILFVHFAHDFFRQFIG